MTTDEFASDASSGALLRVGDVALPPSRQRERGGRFAGGLYELGLREGDVFASMLRNVPEAADVVHAAQFAGISFCPINWHFKPAEVKVLIEDSGARVLLAHGELLDDLAEVLNTNVVLLALGPTRIARAFDYGTWLAAQGPYAGPRVSPRGHMAYTSGTTGQPKGVVREPFPFAELAVRQQRLAQLVERAFGIRKACRALMPAPLYHSAPSTFFQNALGQAQLVVVMPRFDAEELLSLIQEHRIDVVYLVPIMYVRLLRLPPDTRRKYDLSSLRFVASTGAPCPPDVKRAMIEWLGDVIHETYASSESGLVTVIDSAEALTRPGSAGRPIGDAKVRILAEDGTECATGQIGSIYVRQPAVADFTYRHNAAARSAIERDGLITMGDMGYLDGDGYLYVCDRASDMVISGGVNIYPAEVENRLMAHPDVFDCAVFGIPDAEYGEQLLAIVEIAAGGKVDEDGLQDWMKSTLASFKVPRRIEIDALPRDDNGKIAKRKLRERYWQGQDRRV